MPPCVLHEDEHLLVVNKPAGWNTHAPSPHAGEGIYDWLRHREPRWATLAIIHRLDKETSGVLVFARTPLANRSLTEQFTRHEVRKRYVLLTDRAVPANELRVVSALTRAGEHYVSRPLAAGGERAETLFQPPEAACETPLIRGQANAGVMGATALIAAPFTGRTHQIRVHAAASGFPILGDVLYGGTPAARVCLHAAEISFTHPATGAPVTFTVPADFNTDTRLALRAAFIEPGGTDAFRLLHGAADGWPGWYVDRLGDFLLSQSDAPLTDAQRGHLDTLLRNLSLAGAYHKRLNRQVRRASTAEASPELVLGRAAPERFIVRENGMGFELSFHEGYSTGLFLDQRDNRRRLLTGHVAGGFGGLSAGAMNPAGESPPATPGSASPAPPPEVLNTFAYTCGFSVCAAKSGARVTSLDLSKKYLEWGRRNFALNHLDPAAHDFIYGDAFDWMKRLAKKGRAFDGIVLDPPTFSQSEQRGVFRAETDFGELVAAALPLLKPGGLLLASTNAARLEPEKFLAHLAEALAAAGRRGVKQHYVPQPPDFQVTREEPAYLKTAWLRVS